MMQSRTNHHTRLEQHLHQLRQLQQTIELHVQQSQFLAASLTYNGTQITDVNISVMSFNVWVRGGKSLRRCLEVIRSVRSDIVGLQEADQYVVDYMAKELGYFSHPGVHVISRFPITQYFAPDGVVIEIKPCVHVVVFNIHLTAYPYGPHELARGSSVDSVLALEQETRVVTLRKYISAVQQASSSFQSPVLLLGDFNAPSVLDSAISRWPEVAWPTSLACLDAGLIDTFRAANPDVVSTPGITWTPLTSEEPYDCFDRIDYIYVTPHPELAVISASTVDSDTVGFEWPSDHRAVVSKLYWRAQWDPASNVNGSLDFLKWAYARTLERAAAGAAVEFSPMAELVDVDTPVVVRLRRVPPADSANDRDWIALVPVNAPDSSHHGNWVYVHALRQPEDAKSPLEYEGALANGMPGEFEVRYFRYDPIDNRHVCVAKSGKLQVISEIHEEGEPPQQWYGGSNDIRLECAGVPHRVTVECHIATVGVRWHAPIARRGNDWIGLYEEHVDSVPNATNGHWEWVPMASFEGVNETSGVLYVRRPERAGRYQFRYHCNGKYENAAVSVSFTIG